MNKRFSIGALARRAFWFHWRANLALIVGSAIGCTVLTGALLVGDSVRGSLRGFALDGLGHVEIALHSGKRMFRNSLADSLQRHIEARVAPALAFDATALLDDDLGGAPRQLNRVRVYGVDERFWSLSKRSTLPLPDDAMAVSRSVAEGLGLSVGSEVALRIALPGMAPRDAPLASRATPQTRRGRLPVWRILEDDEMGRFSLNANQAAPPNVFVPLEWLQELAALEGKANLLLLGPAANAPAPTPADADAALRAAWRLEDAGLRVREFPERAIAQIESERIFIDPPVERALTSAPSLTVHKPVGVMVYLVNSISVPGAASERFTPYSFVVAADPSEREELSPVAADMTDNDIALNRWTADQLGVNEGDPIDVGYSVLMPDGSFEERSRRFTLKRIVEMSALEAERELMPEFPGLTTVESCAEWDIGLPMNPEWLHNKPNEAYWREFGPTPKAIFTRSAGEAMWATRFGALTSIRFRVAEPNSGAPIESIREAIDPAGVGLFFTPIRSHALRAVDQAEDLAGYFLGMSFFLVASAFMLTGLLFTFGLLRRANEIGLLLGIGFRPSLVKRLMLLEGGLAAFAGAALGVCGALLYTRTLVRGLSTLWKGAVAGSAIQFHWSLETLAIGGSVSFFAALFAMWFTLRRLSSHTPSVTMRAEAGAMPLPKRQTRPWPARPAGASLLIGALGAIAAVSAAFASGPAHRAPLFFASGAALLLACLGACACLLNRLAAASSESVPSLPRLARRYAARRAGRSLTVVGLLAGGSFMVFSTLAMIRNQRVDSALPHSGTGGFALYAETTVALPDPLDSPRTRAALGLDAEEALDGLSAVSLRARGGDDASCLNLNQPLTPSLIGVPAERLLARGAFVRPGASPVWERLRGEPDSAIVPGLAGDADTAMFGLKLRADPERGDTIEYRDERGETFRVRLVGHLPMRLSIFQGAVLVPIEALAHRFPSDAGFRVFLIDSPSGKEQTLQQALQRRLDRHGLDVTPSFLRLEEFYTVEATYLSMFIVLGGLGLALGTFGLGLVVLRNIIERRGEYAALRCMGFAACDVVRLVEREHAFLLVLGLLSGAGASLLALLPNLATPGTDLPIGFLVAMFVTIAAAGRVWIRIAGLTARQPAILSALRDE